MKLWTPFFVLGVAVLICALYLLRAQEKYKSALRQQSGSPGTPALKKSEELVRGMDPLSAVSKMEAKLGMSSASMRQVADLNKGVLAPEKLNEGAQERGEIELTADEKNKHLVLFPPKHVAATEEDRIVDGDSPRASLKSNPAKEVHLPESYENLLTYFTTKLLLTAEKEKKLSATLQYIGENYWVEYEKEIRTGNRSRARVNLNEFKTILLLRMGRTFLNDAEVKVLSETKIKWN